MDDGESNHTIAQNVTTARLFLICDLFGNFRNLHHTL